MTYQDQATLYLSPGFRSRGSMCCKEQGLIFAADGRADIAALGRGVVAGNAQDIDSILSAVVTYPGAGDLNDDAALLGAVQYVWPTVAAARYPQT